jgi:glutamine transport system substrate-binding protein
MNRLFITSLVLTAVLMGCDRHSSSSRPSDIVIIGVDPNHPPFAFVDSASGGVIGFDVDLFATICQANRWQYEFRAIAGDSLDEALKRGDIDVAVAEPLETAVDDGLIVCSDPYYLTGLVLVVSSGKTYPTWAESWQGLTVATPADLPAGALSERLKGATVQTYTAPETLLSELANDRLAALVVDFTRARRMIVDRPELQIVPGLLTTTYYSVAMRAGDSLRVDRFNDALASLLGGYTYERLHQKWFGYPLLNVAVPDSVSACWEKP